MLSKDAIDFKRLTVPRVFPVGPNSFPYFSATLLETTG